MAPRRTPLSGWNVLIAAVVSLGLAAMGPARAAEADSSKAFFAQHCQACHAGTKPKGNFRLESLTQDFSDKANRERWLAVLEQVKAGTMPPKEKPRPPAKDVAGPGRLDQRAGGSGGGRPECRPGPGGPAPPQPGRVREHRARPAGRGRRSERPAAAGHVDERLRQQRRGAARLLLPDGAIPGSGRPGSGRGHRQRAAAADDQETLRHQGRKVRQTDGQRLSPPGRRRGDLQLVGLGQYPGHAVEFPHPRPRQVSLPHFRLRLPDGQAGHLSRDGRHPDGGDRGAPRRLLRRPRRQADRGRVRRATGAAEHDSDSSRTGWA